MSLIEPSVKYHIHDTLHLCHEKKTTIQKWVFNLIGYTLFFIVVGLVLYFCRKRKLTPYEEAEKMRRDQDYIMAKIKQYQTAKRPDNTSAITNLPVVNQNNYLSSN